MSCRHYKRTLKEYDRHYVPEPEYNNCVLCVSQHKGPLTQEVVGNYLGLSKMRISQIEKIALEKLKKRFGENNPLHS